MRGSFQAAPPVPRAAPPQFEPTLSVLARERGRFRASQRNGPAPGIWLPVPPMLCAPTRFSPGPLVPCAPLELDNPPPARLLRFAMRRCVLPLSSNPHPDAAPIYCALRVLASVRGTFRAAPRDPLLCRRAAAPALPRAVRAHAAYWLLSAHRRTISVPATGRENTAQ